MKKILGALIIPIILMAFIGTAEAIEPIDYSQFAMSKKMSENPCATNPCSMKNPCATNPCSMKNPCATNPCAMKNPCATNPCSIKNPCATNPCSMKNPCASGELKYSEKLWKDVSLGNSGKSCSTCHPNGQGLYNTPYPRYIKMPDKVVTLKEMINFCMEVPMKAEHLDVNGPKMEALVEYINEYINANSSAPNPCAMKNPCGMNNPCATNPCSMKNPCGASNPCSMKNPCATNPCAMRNPCGG